MLASLPRRARGQLDAAELGREGRGYELALRGADAASERELFSFWTSTLARVIHPELVIAATAAAVSAEPWHERALDTLPRIGEILTALLGAIAVAGIVRTVYRRTIGRRRDRYARLARLGANAQVSFFTSVLGEPPAMRRTFEHPATVDFDEAGNRVLGLASYVECVWIDRDFYVHAIADEDHTVHAYSVTTRSRRFRPALSIPGGSAYERRWPLSRIARFAWGTRANPRVTLGKTRFGDIEPPGQSACWVGAHNYHYFEAHYFGNPGYYQHFVFSINDAGVYTAGDRLGDEFMHTFAWGFGDADTSLDPRGQLRQAIAVADAAAGDGEGEDDWKPPDDPPRPERWQAFRRDARPNTYTVIGPALLLDDYPLAGEEGLARYPTAFGVNSSSVRTLG